MKNKISLVYIFLCCLIGRVNAFQVPAHHDTINFTFNKMPEVLPGTKPLSQGGDLSAKMLDGAHKFIERKIDESVASRSKLWNRDFSSREVYEQSIEPNRK